MRVRFTTLMWTALAAIMLSTGLYGTAIAQNAEQESVTTAADLIVESLTEAEIDTPPTPDAADPFTKAQIAEKLNALDAAERDVLDALRANQAVKAPASASIPDADGLDTEAQAPDAPKKESRIPKSPEAIKALGMSIASKVVGWLTSPPFLAQLGLIALAYFLSPALAAQTKKRLFFLRDAPADTVKFKLVRGYVYRAGEFLRAIMLVAILALGAVILKAVPALGQDWLVKLAQGLAVVFLLYSAIKTFITNALFQKIAIWVLIPLALLMVFGYFDNLIDGLNGTVLMQMGDTPITAMTVVRLVIFGAIFFKLGNYSNAKGQTAIRSQEGMDTATQEVVAKIFQILLFTIVAVMVLSAAKVPLSGLVMIFSALSLGIGLGLQPIAANFVSGMIILFDRSVKVGDFVVLPDGQSGFVDAINMRNTIVETTDGKDIMVPNTQFTEDAYENWTHKDPRQRYEVEFTIHYDTDLDILEDILIPAVLKHPKVLREPEMPDLELRALGDNGAQMAIEFWCEGVDDGENKFTSDVNFIVWRTLKAHDIKMAYPQHEVRVLK